MRPVNSNFTEAEMVRDIGYVLMKDGTRIAHICYRPKSGRHPTVFWYSPYTASAAPFDIAKPFLEAGYAFVGANFPATGCSEGILDCWFDRKEGSYGAEVVEWIAAQPWSDGNVGMVGNSSAGTVQFWVAAERPSHLRAIVASGVEDGYEDCYAVGGMFHLGMATWALETEFVRQVDGAEWRIREGDTECAAVRDSGKQVVKRAFFDEAKKRPLKDEWWDSIYLARDEIAGKINIPTMLIASWQDEYGGAARESTRLFTQLLAKVKHKKLLLMNGDHSIAGPGPKGYSLVDTERMRFLDRWVKGIENGIEQELPVTVFWDVWEPDGDAKKSAAGWTTMHETWPEATVERRPFFLTADATLSLHEPDASPAEGLRAYLYPTGAELVGSNQQFAIQPYWQGVLNYRTAPASSDMVLLGNPEITLYLSIDHGDDSDLELTLKDIDPDGNVLYLQGGLLRASLRAVDEARTYADEVVHSFRKSEKLVPGQIYAIRMSLLNPIAHAVRQGHCLELTIGAPNPIPHSVYSCIPAGGPSIN
ncbi:MAG: CocE/NonD family hydrolase, partial [Mesorhizobium sp.]